ncbi:MAG: ester cyclase [candidate division KSB1 bacterium]|nr:ester cyclase [candidate division KSB1 bacterium]MDZ7303642.1 ester cyclase [candidate division KSB1 bacterium]MDZ7313338.1 ester cyclase [candidate division KSB1 bacterium]
MFSTKGISPFCLVLTVLCASNASLAAGDEEKNAAAMKRFYEEVVNKGNLKLIDELVAAEFVEHEELPGMKPGREGVKEFFTMFRAAFPDLQFQVNDLVAKGDKVWAYITIRGTHKGQFMDMAATGKTIEVKGFDLIRFVNGKAAEHWGLTDSMTMMMQLGAMPMPGQGPPKQ